MRDSVIVITLDIVPNGILVGADAATVSGLNSPKPMLPVINAGTPRQYVCATCAGIADDHNTFDLWETLLGVEPSIRVRRAHVPAP